MEECLNLEQAPVARGVVSALHSREFFNMAESSLRCTTLITRPILSWCWLYEKL